MTNRERAEEAHNLVSIHSNTELRIGAIEAALDAACQEERERCAVIAENPPDVVGEQSIDLTWWAHQGARVAKAIRESAGKG